MDGNQTQFILMRIFNKPIDRYKMFTHNRLKMNGTELKGRTSFFQNALIHLVFSFSLAEKGFYKVEHMRSTTSNTTRTTSKTRSTRQLTLENHQKNHSLRDHRNLLKNQPLTNKTSKCVLSWRKV